jgi:predicted amidohydrolase YtcJ
MPTGLAPRPWTAQTPSPTLAIHRPPMRHTPRTARATAAGLALAVLTACQGADPGPPADVIFVGDDIVTMDEDQPTVEAVAIRGETIVAAGAADDVMALRGESTRMVELGDHALLPGFIDAHGHMTAVGASLDQLSLHPPPVGDVTSIDDMVEKIRAWIVDHDIPPGEPVRGSGYDDSLLREGRHPTRFDLDRASTDHPIILGHVSGHLTAVNSKALEISGITAQTADPAGGHIRRVRGSTEPDGVLEENASGLLTGLGGGGRSDQDFDTLVRAAIDEELAHGITTIQEGSPTGVRLVEAIRAVAESTPLNADVAVLTNAGAILDGRLQYERSYTNGMRVAGVKFVLDGSPQGRTAWMTEPYTEGPPGATADYVAYPTMDPDEYKAAAGALLRRGVPFLAHSNGDAAMDLMMDGVEEGVTGMDPKPDHRSVIVHAQLMRRDQIQRAKRLGVVPSFFAAHTFFWGDWHVRSFGEERGTNVSPTGWAREEGVPFTLHNDAPVVPPDIMRLVSIAVNRTSRSGRVLGAEHRLTPYQALRAVTLDAAYQYFEEDTKGSITVGKQADLVILGENPLTADPAGLADIPIVETFSRGRSVYLR